MRIRFCSGVRIRYEALLVGESPRTTPAMDNRTVDKFVSEDFDTDSECDAEDEDKTETMTIE